jgi:CMP-N-acetylneuraminic acid synthetase
MNTLLSICARGGSQGLPGKNIRPLLGKPLIAWTIEQALASGLANQVYVSTDDAAIMDVARAFGAEVPFQRPAGLATAAAGKLPVIQHLVGWLEAEGTRVDRVLDLDPTSPLRDVADILACAALLDDETDVVITGCESDKNPYFNMVERKEHGFYGRVCTPDVEAVGRQAAPVVYAMNASIYAWHRRTLSASLWSQRRIRLHPMPRERSIDIDHAIDFEMVELLMKLKLGS